MSGSNWQYLAPYGIGQPGSPSASYGGVTYRDELDARRAQNRYARTPTAEYPDGYLGTSRKSRYDRLLNQQNVRITQKNYQRGVHKGTRIDAADYFWPPDFGPSSGLEIQATGMRQTVRHETQGLDYLSNGRAVPRGAMSIIDPYRRERQEDFLRPRWG